MPLIVNDSLEVALKSGADGVHVGIEDQPVAEIRRQAGKGFLIGATAKTVEQARAAQAAVIKAQKAGKTTVDISGKNGSSDSESPDEI